jgi:hypothetical protein
MKTKILIIISFFIQNTILSQSRNDTIFYQNKQIKAIRKVGYIWTYFEQRGKILFEYDYSKDSMLQYNIDSKRLNYPDIMDISAFERYNVAPNFYHSHCYSSNSIRVIYPPKEAEGGIEGMVIVSLNIDKYGNLIKKSIKKSLTQACDNECLKILEVYNKCWLPALKDNKFVDSEIDLNFSFKLE